MFPKYWQQFLQSHHLEGKSACLDEDSDLSASGADLQFLTAIESTDEMTNAWPGIGVAKDGFVAVASCLVGTGDYYYINANDGNNGPLYRVYHDAVGPNGYILQNAVDIVLNHYEDILSHIEP